MGLNLKSLAVIRSMDDDGNLVFEDEPEVCENASAK